VLILVVSPLAGRSATVEAAFDSASDIPVTATQFQAAGNELAITLGFDPLPGDQLTVVEVTGLEPVDGEFSNLAHGQTVILSHEGNPYPYVANYYGGNGNDLVLHWANTEVYAWGSNAYGQLGIPYIQDHPGTPFSSVPVSSMNAASAFRNRFPVAIAHSQVHALALCSDGTVIGWGSDQVGRLGNGTDSDIPGFTELVSTGVLSGKRIKSIAAGYSFGLALCTDGTIVSWGSNQYGQLGTGSESTYSTVPVLVDQTGVLAGRQVVSIAAGGSLALAVCADGGVVSWGSGALGRDGPDSQSSPAEVDRSGVLASRSVVSVSTDTNFGKFVLAICSDGAVVTWGNNDSGQLGVGDQIDRPIPVLVGSNGALSGKSVVAGTAGRNHSVVVCSDNSLVSWGANSQGALGNGTTDDSSLPVAVDQTGILAGRRVTSLSASGMGTVATCSDGFLIGWGQIHTPASDQTRPFAVGDRGVLAGRAVVQAVISSFSVIALCSDGLIAGWGVNGSRILGELQDYVVNTPAAIRADEDDTHPFEKPVLAVVCGGDHSHALTSDGKVWSWGSNAHGALGAGLPLQNEASHPTPVEVPIPGAAEGRRVSSIVVGYKHGVALCTDGSLFAWGNASNGLLGAVGISNPSTTPVPVDQSGALAGKRVIRIRAHESYSVALCSDGSLVT
jgi:alpha-tubulin suppressor-like RCC1 family protein